MCIMLCQHMAFSHAGFFDVKNLCCTSSVKLLQILAALIHVVSAFCWCLSVKDFHPGQICQGLKVSRG